MVPCATCQTRSFSLFGWGAPKSSEAAPDPFPPPPPEAAPQNAVETASIDPSTTNSIRSVKASHATSDTPDPSLAATTAPHTPEPALLHDLENAIAAPHGTAGPPELNLASIPERIGYLKDVCGLDYGWGPTATLEWVLEHLHLTAGLSWTLAIPALALLSRLCVFKFVRDAADMGARLREAKPLMDPLREKMLQAARAKDNALVMQHRLHLQAVQREYGIKMSKAFLPILIQIPLQFGGFRLLRGMSALPVPAFEHENWLWTFDLTQGDPYYMLPLMTSTLLYFNLKIGSETGGAPMQGPMKEILFKALPAMNLIFMGLQPGAVQLYFATTSTLAFGQTLLMRNPTARRLLALPPLAAPATASDAPPPGGLTRSSSSVTIETDPSPPVENRSVVDKGVDAMKGQFSKMGAGWNRTKESVLGSAEERVEKRKKAAATAKADTYEARRRRDLEAERQYKKPVENIGLTDGPPNVIRMPSAQMNLSNDGEREGEDEEPRSVPRRSRKERLRQR